MSDFTTVDEEKLTKAFRLWNERYLTRPGAFAAVIEGTEDFAHAQARYLLTLVEEVR